MSRIKTLTKEILKEPNVYLFEGGMVREHRTVDPLQLAHKMRLASFFVSHILVHPGSLLEEDSLFEAVQTNIGLVKTGQILPVMRGAPDTLESYADRWERAYAAKDRADPFFFQAKKLTKAMVKTILDRAEYFNKEDYMVLSLEPPDRSGLKDRFISIMESILAEEPEIEDVIKIEILEKAKLSSPLGRIRTEIINKHRRDKRLMNLARRINVAFFSVGASELESWFSMNTTAFRDLSVSTEINRAYVAELMELSITRALTLPSYEMIVAIPSDEFADIVFSAEANNFRRLVSDIINKLEEQDITAINRGNNTINEAFSDVYASEFSKLIGKQRRKERKRLNALGPTLSVLGVFADFLGNIAQIPLTGTTMEIAAYFIERGLKSKFAPTIFLQERLTTALQAAAEKPILRRDRGN